VSVRGLQALGRPLDEVTGVARVAVNLRGLPRESVGRGDVLVSPGRWLTTSVLDVRLHPVRPDTGVGQDADPAKELPQQLHLHIGAAAVPVRVRPLGSDPAGGALEGGGAELPPQPRTIERAERRSAREIAFMKKVMLAGLRLGAVTLAVWRCSRGGGRSRRRTWCCWCTHGRRRRSACRLAGWRPRSRCWDPCRSRRSRARRRRRTCSCRTPASRWDHPRTGWLKRSRDGRWRRGFFTSHTGHVWPSCLCERERRVNTFRADARAHEARSDC